jgi:hypothetical protein
LIGKKIAPSTGLATGTTIKPFVAKMSFTCHAKFAKHLIAFATLQREFPARRAFFYFFGGFSVPNHPERIATISAFELVVLKAFSIVFFDFPDVDHRFFERKCVPFHNPL